MDERWKRVEQEMEHSGTARKAQYQANEDLNLEIKALGGRLGNVEKALATAEPTIQEFITIKHKVVGAGALGKWLWAAGAVLIGWAYGAREHLLHFFATKGP